MSRAFLLFCVFVFVCVRERERERARARAHPLVFSNPCPALQVCPDLLLCDAEGIVVLCLGDSLLLLHKLNFLLSGKPVTEPQAEDNFKDAKR